MGIDIFKMRKEELKPKTWTNEACQQEVGDYEKTVWDPETEQYLQGYFYWEGLYSLICQAENAPTNPLTNIYVIHMYKLLSGKKRCH